MLDGDQVVGLDEEEVGVGREFEGGEIHAERIGPGDEGCKLEAEERHEGDWLVVLVCAGEVGFLDGSKRAD